MGTDEDPEERLSPPSWHRCSFHPHGVRLETSHDRDPRPTCRRGQAHDIEMMSDFELRRGPHLRPHGQRPSSMVCVFSRRHVPQEIGHERSGSVPTGESGSKLLHRLVCEGPYLGLACILHANYSASHASPVPR